MAIGTELEPPPRGNALWGFGWIQWLYNLYKYVRENVTKNDPWLDHAIDVIAATYGDKVSIQAKNKDLLKYGRSTQVSNATRTTLMTLPAGTLNETYVTTNLIDSVSSESTSDANKILKVEGHTIDASGNLTFVVQSVTLAANPTTTAATLTTPLARCNRAYLADSGTFGSPQSDLVGPVYIYDDSGGVTLASGVPSVAAQVHLMIRGGQNQSEKCATSISSTDYWIVTGVYANVLDKTGSPLVDIGFETRDIVNGGVWRESFEFSADNSGVKPLSGTPYVIVPTSHDVRLRALASSAGTEVSGGIYGVLAKVV